MSRRGNNEGSLYHRPDGRWEARITLPDGNRKSFYAPTRALARDRLTQAQHDLAKGLPIVAEKQTVGQYLEDWLASMAMQVDPSTWRRYHDQVTKHISPHIGKVILARLDAHTHLMPLYAACKKAGLAHGTIRHLHGILHHALSDAQDLGLVQRNAAKAAKAPRAEARDIQPLTEDQANAFLAYLQLIGHRNHALYALATYIGLREGELLGLHWGDVHLERKEVHVHQAIKEGSKGYVLGDTKTANSDRTIKLNALAIASLQRHHLVQLKERRLLGSDWHESGLVFPNELGLAYRPSTIYMQFQRLLRDASLPRRRFHDLRHTCATILLAHGIPVKQVSEMLGHSDIAITLRVYGHVIPSMNEAAASMMDMVFQQQGGGPDDRQDAF